MRVLFDLRWMVVGKAGGMEQMAFELVASLSASDSEDRFWLYCPQATFDEWSGLDEYRFTLIDSDRFALIPEHCLYDATGSERTPGIIGVGSKPGTNHADRFSIEIDLIHAVGGYLSEELRGYRSIVTAHDLQHLHFPENFDKIELGARSNNYAASFEAASAIACVSDCVACDVIERFSLDAAEVETIWNIPSGAALDPVAATAAKKVARNLVGDIAFLFFPSHAWPHKNHLALVDAFAGISKSETNIQLVMTGGRFDESHPVAKRIRELDLESRIVHLGYRTPFEIRCLFKEALALVYPSLFEGFGMPVAEAILAGTPIACSDIAPLREVGGDAILTFDPHDPSDIESKILQLLENRELREDLIGKGKKRRGLFEPSRIAQQTSDLYRRASSLDSVGIGSNKAKRSRRWEMSQHWGRKYEELREESLSIAAMRAWLGIFWHSPKRAMSLLCGRTGQEDGTCPDQFKRHGDGWIGPRFEDWLMVPEGAIGIEFHFDGPPQQFRENARIRLSIEHDSAFEGGFEGRDSITQSARLPKDCPDIIKIEVSCSRYFTPQEHGLSADKRRLSAKFAWIRWLR